MQYCIECGETFIQLEHFVKARLRDGWLPLGGPTALPGPILGQALLKPESPACITPEALRTWRLCNGLPTT